MGAVAKSMSHPYNNLNLTFGDLRNMMLGLTSGQIFGTEKFDGTNMHWYIAEDGFPRFARNFSDVKIGGLSMIEMAARLSEQPYSVSQFINGMKAIQRMKDDMNWTLRRDGTYWINCEIIDSKNPQCYKYDTDHIVFHRLVTPNEKRSAMKPVIGSQVQTFVQMVQNVMTGDYEGWTVLPPTPIFLESKEGNVDIADCFSRLDQAMKNHGCEPKHKLSYFVRAQTIAAGEMMGMSEEDANYLADACLSVPGAPTIHYLRSVSKSVDGVNKIAMSKNRRKWINNCMKELMDIWTVFGAHILDGVSSSIIEDPSSCVHRLEKLIEWNITQLGDVYIESHRDLYNRTIDYLAQFELLHVKPPAIEGIVYEWKGHTYKVTGAFPSMNRVCGAVRYELNKKFPEEFAVCA